MVGNDVVDLRDPDSDSSSYRSRFDERVFCRAERRSIDRAHSPERERWRLWAAKEASFKLARKRDASVVFSPRAFAVVCDEDHPPGPLRVVHEKHSCFVEFDETPQRIHAIAVSVPEAFASVLSGIDRTRAVDGNSKSESESEGVRRLACDAISQHFDLARDQLEIRKSINRIPKLFHRQARLELSISLSHHGNWLAFACCKGEHIGA